ncbi:sorting nexin-24 isoform X2 [Acinonyx jubatus]|uniref:Sorting nexin-24 isoform X2 n=1 Tax=Acinonyx jubatus TaxID=32536 RepID=A0ABM3PX63_ACIJB|nr:sorting nexin-24 isoform X2 [Acinonyx jubatus]
MLFCRPRSRHPLGWRLGNCRHSSGGRPKDRERPGAARSRRLARRRAHPFSADSQVFKIEVLMNGRKHFVEKRYSEFHALHKKLKKCIKTPEIPSKHVRNWVPKVLEQRRQGLETYLQAVILENEELPKLFLDFLNVRHLPSLPKAESCGSFDETESEESSKLSHQPVLLFLRDPYVLPAASDFPNVVIEGVLHGIFYPHLQPRYGVCPGHKLPAIPREDVPGSWAPAIRSEESQPHGYPTLLLLEKLTTK